MHFQPVEPVVEDGYVASGGEQGQPSPAADDPVDDDVWGSGPPSPSTDHHSAHPSDVRRLQTEHTTAGYREGVNAAKESSMQAGFDEGFSLGATIGLRAGQLLGNLEAVAEAVQGRAGDDVAAAERLVGEARTELSAESIFGAEYWAPDGNWSYAVEAADGEDVVFADVASAHPLVRKWAGVVDEQARLWKIDRSLLDDENGPRLESVSDDMIASTAVPTAKKPLDW